MSSVFKTNGLGHPADLIYAYSAKQCVEALAVGRDGITMLPRALITGPVDLNKTMYILELNESGECTYCHLTHLCTSLCKAAL